MGLYWASKFEVENDYWAHSALIFEKCSPRPLLVRLKSGFLNSFPFIGPASISQISFKTTIPRDIRLNLKVFQNPKAHVKYYIPLNLLISRFFNPLPEGVAIRPF